MAEARFKKVSRAIFLQKPLPVRSSRCMDRSTSSMQTDQLPVVCVNKGKKINLYKTKKYNIKSNKINMIAYFDNLGICLLFCTPEFVLII